MKVIGWNVDTQYDFMKPDGKLYVQGAEKIESDLEKLTRKLRYHEVQVVNTADWHNEDSAEISDNPDFKTTYPEHCMENTPGAAYVPATAPDSPYVIDWKDESFDESKVKATRNIVLYKDQFSIFTGTKHTNRVLDSLRPDRAIVYGVATNVCVNFAVKGLLERGIEVYVVKDAIKELPPEQAAVPLEQTLKEWEGIGNGVKYTTVDEVDKYLG